MAAIPLINRAGRPTGRVRVEEVVNRVYLAIQLVDLSIGA
jgi:hypothetical protein